MAGWDDAQNILCIRLDAIGDLIMTTPAIRAIQQSRPDRRITLLTSPAGQGIAPFIPDIETVISYDAPWMKATAPRITSQPEFEMVQRLRAARFDAAVIFTVFSQNPLPAAFLCYLAEIPLRLAHCHENPYQLLTDWILDPEPSQGIRHEVRRQLDLVAAVGCQIADERMGLTVQEADRQRVLGLLDGLRVERDRPWVVIHPGATAASRRYPPEKFAAVAQCLILDANFQVIFTGVESEREWVQNIQTQMQCRSHSLIGKLSLGEMIALVATTPLLISNNTGPVHMASALGTPVIDLYALTNPQHTPWQVPHRVLSHDVPCKFCYKSVCPEGHNHCLTLVTVDEVVRAALELWSETQENPADRRQEASGCSSPHPLTLPSPHSTSATLSAKDIWK